MLAAERFEERVRAWGIRVEETLETESSLMAFGTRGGLPVVLKVLRREGDEWWSGEALQVFEGKGTVKVYEHVGGAVLLERLVPGTELASLSFNNLDEEATEILAGVIRQISSATESVKAFATVEDWGEGFGKYLASGDVQIPKELVAQGQRTYMQLCASQQNVRLLHGDLQHYNVLFDAARGWLAIDPKGVVGEVEYEIGASLRNPYQRPELFASPETVLRRVKQYESLLKLDAGRMLRWGFAQAVLSAIWSVEDGLAVDARNPALMLADAIQKLLEQI